MNVSGLTPIQLIEKPGGSEIQLHTNQRVSAEILSVSGDQVELMIRGIRVVGKLVAQEQSAELANRQSAQFIVKGMVNGELQLKLLDELQSVPINTQENQWITLSKNLLHLLDLPETDNNLILAKALLKNNLPVTKNLMDTLQQALQTLGKWGDTEAEMAAALKAGGFPISNGSLELALQKLPGFNSNINELQTVLQQQLDKTTAPEARQLIQNGLQLLDQLRIDLSASPEKMAEQIKNVISFFGKSIESNLANLLDGKNPIIMKQTDGDQLNSLLQLRSLFSGKNDAASVKMIDSLLNSMRQMQFLNTAQITDTMDPPWLIVNLPINAGALMQPQLQHQNDPTPANIKISYQSGKKDKKIDPQDTRLILSFELDNTSQIKIDISMLGRKMGAWMTVNSELWKERVDEEAESFQEAMKRLGYELQFTKCSVNQDISMADGTEEKSEPIMIEKVNIKV
jgi:hypothetical protein